MPMLEMRVPGDKSIAHRALMLATLAEGESRVGGVSEALDVASTADALRALGATIDRDGDDVRVRGRGAASLRPPAASIDCGNSGTTARFSIGLAAALRGETTLTGDASLRRRPMERIAAPLRLAGADIDYLAAEDRLPLRVRGGSLHPIVHRSAVASAQVKSALLIAGVGAGVDVAVEEPVLSRDHTERLLRSMGATVESFDRDGFAGVRLSAPVELSPVQTVLPGDFSSAAFLLAATCIAGGARIALRGVGVNPTRTGLLDVLARMGGDVVVDERREAGGEPVADLHAGPADLVSTRVAGDEAVRLVDELPLLGVLAAHARGETIVSGAAELRAKESDRIHALCTNLRVLGVDVEERPDGFVVRGDVRPLSGSVRSFGDHRIAMAFAVLGLRAGSSIEVDDLEIAAVSFPGFLTELARLRDSRPAIIGGGAT